MPVELSIVESVTELNTTVVEVVLESASEPGPAGPGVAAGGTTGQVLVKATDTDYDTEWDDVAGAGAPDAADVTFTPAGGLSSTDVQAALEEVDSEKAAASHAHAGEDITSGTVADARVASTIARDSEVSSAVSALSTVYQPLDSDLTAVAALTTTTFGRGLLELANQAALLSAAGAAAASHVHAGEDITSGTVADARIDSAIARDSEVSSAIAALSSVYQPLDSDLTAIAALTTTSFGRGLLELADEAAFKAALNLEAGTDYPSQTTFDDHSARHENGGADEISLSGLDGTPTDLQAHLDDTSDAHDASAISVLDSGGNYTATDVEGVLAEIAPQLGGSSPYLVDWHPWSPRNAESGTWFFSVANNRMYCGDWTVGSPANTDFLEYKILLSAGTWTFQLAGTKFTNSAISTISIDGSSVGTIDQYASGAVLNQLQTVTGIVVATTGVKLVRIATATKNASSSSFAGRYVHFSMFRTA